MRAREWTRWIDDVKAFEILGRGSRGAPKSVQGEGDCLESPREGEVQFLDVEATARDARGVDREPLRSRTRWRWKREERRRERCCIQERVCERGLMIPKGQSHLVGCGRARLKRCNEPILSTKSPVRQLSRSRGRAQSLLDVRHLRGVKVLGEFRGNH